MVVEGKNAALGLVIERGDNQQHIAKVDGENHANQIAKHETVDDRIERKLRELVHSWGLSRFSEEMAWRWLRKSLGAAEGVNCNDIKGNDELERVRKWVLLQLNHVRLPADVSRWQVGCPEVIPGLRATPLWNNDAFPWIKHLEAAYPVIKSELLSLKGKRGFQPYRAPSWASDTNARDGYGSQAHDAGDWNVFYLYLHNMDFHANRELCPNTISILQSLPLFDHYDHTFFSALAPQTHIKKHHGPTNKKLRCHLPLVVPQNQCGLRVGDHEIQVEEGKCFVFDDSYEHEAWNNDPNHARIVLILDVWHPDLSESEKKFLSFLRNAQLRIDKQQSKNIKDSFYTIIEEVNQANLSVPDAIWS